MNTESIYRQPEHYIVYSPIFSLRWRDIDAALLRLSNGHPPYYAAKTTNAQGCWIANKMHNGHGYIKLKVAGGGRREFYAHHLARARVSASIGSTRARTRSNASCRQSLKHRPLPFSL